MARPKKPVIMETVSVRLPSSMLVEIDAYIEDIKTEMPLLNIGRADGIRQLIADGITYRDLNRRKKRKS
jgi:metal-responsive CopG/Arc/MetJ family transcriptional regulator